MNVQPASWTVLSTIPSLFSKVILFITVITVNSSSDDIDSMNLGSSNGCAFEIKCGSISKEP